MDLEKIEENIFKNSAFQILVVYFDIDVVGLFIWFMI